MGLKDYSLKGLLEKIESVLQELAELRNQKDSEPEPEKPPIPIGSLCEFWDNEEIDTKFISVLTEYISKGNYPYDVEGIATYHHAKPHDGPNTPLPWQWNTGKKPKFPEGNHIVFVEYQNKFRTCREGGDGFCWDIRDNDRDILKYAIVRF